MWYALYWRATLRILCGQGRNSYHKQRRSNHFAAISTIYFTRSSLLHMLMHPEDINLFPGLT